MGKGSEQTFLQGSHTNGQQACEKVLNIINHQGNVNQNQKSPCICVRMAIILKMKIFKEMCW